MPMSQAEMLARIASALKNQGPSSDMDPDVRKAIEAELSRQNKGWALPIEPPKPDPEEVGLDPQTPDPNAYANRAFARSVYGANRQPSSKDINSSIDDGINQAAQNYRAKQGDTDDAMSRAIQQLRSSGSATAPSPQDDEDAKKKALQMQYWRNQLNQINNSKDDE